MDGRARERWWDTWAPYWAELENHHFGRDTIDRVMPFVAGPALVVGAGHGLLVEHLMGKGVAAHGVDSSEAMVDMARRRRALRLVHVDGRALPFDDAHFRTVIVSSGVVDYEPEPKQVARVLGESWRVLGPGGSLLVGFYRFPTELDEIYHRLGVLDGAELRMDRMFEIHETVRQRPLACVPRIAAWTGRPYWRTLLWWIRAGLAVPAALREEKERVDEVFRAAEQDGLGRRRLIESVPATLPYRDEAGIRALLDEAGQSGAEVIHTPDCIVARIRKTG
ncbi:MAG: class I SAM-dependent methyltransferase [Deltaproteobacteria bacterium]|nr:class I SAM-dependent methyltransferase [Deltaproteobacteria bacterium]